MGYKSAQENERRSNRHRIGGADRFTRSKWSIHIRYRESLVTIICAQWVKQIESHGGKDIHKRQYRFQYIVIRSV